MKKHKIMKAGSMIPIAGMSFLMLLICLNSVAQAQVSLREAVELSLQNNLQIRSANLEIENQRLLKRAAIEVPKTHFQLTRGQYNSHITNDNNLTITQTVPFPTLWIQQAAMGRARVESQQLSLNATSNAVAFDVSSAYVQLLFLKARHHQLVGLDTLFEGLAKSASVRYRTGEAPLLETISAETQWNEVKNGLRQNEADQMIYEKQLQVLMNYDQPVGTSETLEQLALSSKGSIVENPELHHLKKEIEVADRWRKVQFAKVLPDITVGFFSQTLIGYELIDGQEQYFGANERFNGFEIGLSIPIWFLPHAARARAAESQYEIAQNEYESYAHILSGQYDQSLKEFEKANAGLDYYRQYALPNADKLESQNILSFRSGEIDYSTFLLNIRTSIAIREGYLNNLRDYHLAVLKLNYITGNSPSYEKE